MDVRTPAFLESQTHVGRAPGPHLLVTGGVHGDELEPVAALRQLSSLVPRQELRGRLTVVPLVNQPAAMRASRCGDDKLDLARVCPGSPHGTITERIAWQLSELIREADFYIDLHTGGAVLEISPLTGYMLHSRPDVLAAQRRMAHAFNLPIVWGTTAQLEGRSLSVARDAGVPAIYAEYGGGGTCDLAGVRALLEGTLRVMSELGMSPRRNAGSNVRHVVEDDRPQSGFLQIQHPAPCEGIFERVARLGQWLDSGDRVGQVISPHHGERVPILASESGKLLMLRTSRQVRAGDALAAILPIREREG